MTNSKSTKRALVSSALAILMCVAMLIGTTFAWFTDTASTGVNKITSGNLHVEIQNEEGTELETLEWVAKDGRAQDKILWEPGATYTLTPFKIANTGKLALKYKLVVTGLDGDADLLKVIHFTYKLGDAVLDLNEEGHLLPGAATGMITVSAAMDKSAGNEYMDKTLEGVEIKVYATQDTVESDSFDDQYDKDAKYPAMASELMKTYGTDGLNMPSGVDIAVDTNYPTEQGKGHYIVTLKDEEAFVYFTQVFDRKEAVAARTEALKNGTVERLAGESIHNNLNIWYSFNITVKLDCDVDLGGAYVKQFSANGQDYAFDGQSHTIKNAKLTGVSGFFANYTAVSNVTLDNVHVTATGLEYASVVEGYSNKNITNVTVKNSSVIGGKYTGAIVGDCYADVTDCTVENTVVSGQYKVGGIVGYVCNEDNGADQLVTGNTLKNVTVKGENILSGKALIIGKIVGNWNKQNNGNAVCKDNTFSGTTTATENIGLIMGTVTES